MWAFYGSLRLKLSIPQNVLHETYAMYWPVKNGSFFSVHECYLEHALCKSSLLQLSICTGTRLHAFAVIVHYFKGITFVKKNCYIWLAPKLSNIWFKSQYINIILLGKSLNILSDIAWKWHFRYNSTKKLNRSLWNQINWWQKRNLHFL